MPHKLAEYLKILLSLLWTKTRRAVGKGHCGQGHRLPHSLCRGGRGKVGSASFCKVNLATFLTGQPIHSVIQRGSGSPFVRYSGSTGKPTERWE